MRLNHRSAPLRFIAGVVASWVLLRAGMALLPGPTPAPDVRIAAMQALPPAPAAPAARPVAEPILAPAPVRRSSSSAASSPVVRTQPPRPMVMLAPYHRAVFEGPMGASHVRWVDPPSPPWPAIARAEPGPVSPPITRQADKRWSGSAWAYVRQDSGPRPLAGGGQIGGSQLGARIAYAVAPPVALAARGYAALGQAGREVALGAEWHPIPGLRVAAERRIAADRAGRDAFSAYAAGGFWREAHGLVADGYAQAGIVGLHSRDLFVDGALRIGKRAGGATVGGGIWAAAQPGAERIDIGPRAAVRLGASPVSLAVEHRFRVAGDASPGSGLALTLAADF